MMTRKRLSSGSFSANEGQEATTSCSQESECQLKPGDIGWIKIKDDSWWPALVVDEKTVYVKHKKKAETEILVRLYGTYEYSFVDPVRSQFVSSLKQENRTMRETFQKALEQDLYRLKSGGKSKNKLSSAKAVSARTEASIGKKQKCDGMKKKKEADDPASPGAPLGKLDGAKAIENEGVDRARDEASGGTTIKRNETRNAKVVKNKNNIIREACQKMLNEDLPVIVSNANSKRQHSESTESATPKGSGGKRQKQDKMRNHYDDRPGLPGVLSEEPKDVKALQQMEELDATKGDTDRKGIGGMKKKGVASSEPKKVKPKENTEVKVSRKKTIKQDEVTVSKSGSKIPSEAPQETAGGGNDLEILESTKMLEAGAPEAKSMRRYPTRSKKETIELKETAPKSAKVRGVRNSKVREEAGNGTPEVNSGKHDMPRKLDPEDSKEDSKPESPAVKRVKLDENVGVSTRKMRVMQNLGLVAPAGSPFQRK